ncbi:MAG: hypothetical protein J1E65_09400 [Lachnospiraceae bacterium]|nr:hypothetical protein [Lachnospiraceae bacterium]
MFGGKEAVLEQILTESGRVIPLGCIMEERESWEFVSDSTVDVSQVPLPYQRDRCFYSTPYDMVFAYSTAEISARCAGTVLIFVDWSSLEDIYDF